MLILATMASSIALAFATSGVALASTPLGQAVQIKPPADKLPAGSVLIYGVGCGGASSCAAAGYYTDTAGHLDPLVATENSGHWARATKVRLPKGVTGGPNAELYAAACPAPGACVAAGFYEIVGGFEGMVASQSHGTWGRARALMPPANSAAETDMQVYALSCTAPGSCVVVGDYTDNKHHNQAFAATESKGSWHRAVELHMPTNAQASPDAFLFTVSCAQAGSCAAGGYYDAKATGMEPVAVTESGGRWHRGTELKLPAGANATNPQALIQGIDCPVASTCEAVGLYLDQSGHGFSFTDSYFRGAWRRASKFTHVPSNAAAHPDTTLTGVACPQAGTCAAVGTYLDQAGGQASLAAFRHGGHWIAALEINVPSNAKHGGTESAIMEGVSCTSHAFCAAAGYYQTTSNVAAGMAATTPSLPAGPG
jgi:hypothetical protein